MRVIPKKNYLLLALLFVVTILVVMYVTNWYKASMEYSLENSIMTSFLGEIRETEIENYILENPDVVIYMSSDTEDSTQKFEKKLKDYIVKEEINSQFIYLNCNNVSSEFISQFQNNYFTGALKKINLTYPNLLIVNDRKVVDILYKLSETPDIKDVQKFLEKNGVTQDA